MLPSSDRPWYWEGNVQRAVVRHLVARGWEVETQADTESRQRGVDVVLRKGERRLAVEVKGYPGTVYARGPKAGQPKPTAPTNQARHWFAQALLAAVLAKTPLDSELGLAFPDMPRFRDLVGRSEWALRRLDVRIFLVGEDGSVETIG